MSSKGDDYDKLSKEEREARDKADREREAAEQAGAHSVVTRIASSLTAILALPYKWRQELGEVDIVVPVPKGTRGRDLSVVIQKKKLSVGLKGKEPIMAGELCREIKMDESTWTLGECSQANILCSLCVTSQRTKKPFISTWRS